VAVLLAAVEAEEAAAQDKKMIQLFIILGILAVLTLFVIATYNSLVKMRNRTREAWYDIEVQLKRRYDLIPNLVNVVKGYADHEKDVFEKITQARANALGAGDRKGIADAEKGVSQALKSLFAVAENYPTLKADQTFINLQEELVDTENKVESSRRYYNGCVRDYNTKQEMFPANIIAGMFNFAKEVYFELENDEERKSPQVKF
jgi:LemA protein